MAKIIRFAWGIGDQVVIVGCGSKSTPMIAQLCRQIGLCSRVVSAEEFPGFWRAAVIRPKLVILSGGDQSVYEEDAITIPSDVLLEMTEQSVVLGVCYGAQLLAHLLGGKVEAAARSESGIVHVESKPFGTYQGGMAVMNHGDEIVTLPEGWGTVASTERCRNAFAGKGNVWAVQFHPEMDHTEGGEDILKHVAFAIAHCKTDYAFDPARFVADAVAEIDAVAPPGPVICGLSGGVDSAVAFKIARRSGIANRLHGIFVDTGWMRDGEQEEVRAQFGDEGISYVNACDRFYDAIEAIPYAAAGHPTEREHGYYDRVRKVMGGTFIDVFLDQARALGEPATSLIQGTNIADIIESTTDLKQHHNVGGLPRQKLGVDVIEPLAGLFKFEIRAIAAYLRLDPEIVHRQPFPGPGLALRAFGKLARDMAPPLQAANRILEEVVRAHYPRHQDRPSQYYVALLPAPSTGIVGDKRVVGYAWHIRMVTSGSRESYVTTDVFHATPAFWRELTHRLTADVRMQDGTRFVRVFYELTGKPPSTTEPH